MRVKTYSRVRCVINCVYEVFSNVNLHRVGDFPHSRTPPKVLGNPSHVKVGGIAPQTPLAVGTIPHAEVVRVILTSQFLHVSMTVYKEKLKQKRWKARLLAGKCSCKTCYNRLFKTYIDRNSEARIIYDLVLPDPRPLNKTYLR